MRPDDADLYEVDLSIYHAIATLYDAGASRFQAEQALRERIEIMFDALDEFEDASRPDGLPPYVSHKSIYH